VMDSLIKEGRVTRGWIGVEPRDLTPEIAKTLDLSVRQGVLITGVVQNGPASEGGVRPGDVVLKIAGTPISNTPQLLNAVAALKPRQTATITVQRGNKPLDLQVTVGQRPPLRPMPLER
jgi:serine protease DegQ